MFSKTHSSQLADSRAKISVYLKCKFCLNNFKLNPSTFRNYSLHFKNQHSPEHTKAEALRRKVNIDIIKPRLKSMKQREFSVEASTYSQSGAESAMIEWIVVQIF
jgi:hypothetical protein